MWIDFKDEMSRAAGEAAINKIRNGDCRFTFQMYPAKRANGKKWFSLRIELVRLKNRKFYCGAHPGPCQAIFKRKEVRRTYLEGADWVGFNHMLNDALDEIQCWAMVFSYNRESLAGKYIIRKGMERLNYYDMNVVGNFFHWATPEDNDYVDCNGKPSPTPVWPSGTPGQIAYRLSEEYKEEEVAA